MYLLRLNYIEIQVIILCLKNEVMSIFFNMENLFVLRL